MQGAGKKQMKQCVTCKELKEEHLYSKNRTRLDGLQAECKTCNKDYRENNKEYIKQFYKQYRHDNADKIKEYRKNYNKCYYKDPEHRKNQRKAKRNWATKDRRARGIKIKGNGTYKGR